MIYTAPGDVTSPKEHIHIKEVIYDGNKVDEIGTDHDYSIAIVNYDGGKDSFAMRWNASSAELDDPEKCNGTKRCIGNPVSRGYPTWFVLPIAVGEEDNFIKNLQGLYNKVSKQNEK